MVVEIPSGRVAPSMPPATRDAARRGGQGTANGLDGWLESAMAPWRWARLRRTPPRPLKVAGALGSSRESASNTGLLTRLWGRGAPRVHRWRERQSRAAGGRDGDSEGRCSRDQGQLVLSVDLDQH